MALMGAWARTTNQVGARPSVEASRRPYLTGQVILSSAAIGFRCAWAFGEYGVP